MTARIDAVGNVIGRYEARPPGAPALLIGSHIDTVTDAGKYDGALGVLAGIAAVEALHRAGERLPVAVEVIAFGDEEGVRFPSALTGSRALAGTLEPGALDARDGAGVQRWRGARRGRLRSRSRHELRPSSRGHDRLSRAPHRAGAGARGGRPAARGGHRDQRRDALAGCGPRRGRSRRHRADGAAARCAGCRRRDGARGRARGPGDADLVATVGQIEARPGAVNVVPGEAHFTVDVRAPSDAVRAAAAAVLEASFAGIAARRGVEVAIERFHEAAAVSCDPALTEQLAAAVGRAGIAPRLLPSGAGHDAMALAALCPVAMLFVRCQGGISHNPAEAITPEDADLAVRVLLDAIRHIGASR